MKLLLVKNDLCDGEYAEPYCGGAGVAMDLLMSEFVHRVHLNDIDPAIHAFWWTVFNEPEELCRRISRTKLSVANWQRQRRILERADTEEQLDLGFAAFYLNRVNRSGILTAGPIGGLNQDGPWTIDARFNRTSLTTLIQSLARFADRVSLYQLDALRFAKEIASVVPKRALVYLDPPYVVKGQRLYLNAYSHLDHKAIAAEIQRSKHLYWVVSYDNVPLIRELYSRRRSIKYRIGYSANQRSDGSEIMVFSDALSVPTVRTPLSIVGKQLRNLLRAA